MPWIHGDRSQRSGLAMDDWRGRLLHLQHKRRPLDNLDAGAPGIRDVGDGVAGGTFAIWFVEFDAFRLELLHEGCVVLHVETDVVEHTPSSRHLLRVGLGEPELYSREVHFRGVVTGGPFPPQGFRVTRLSVW